MNDALSIARLAVHKGKRGELHEGGPSRDLIYLFLSCSGALDNMVTPPHNHQTGSMQIKPPLEVNSFRTSSNSHSPNWFRCRCNESGFAPRLHLASTSLQRADGWFFPKFRSRIHILFHFRGQGQRQQCSWYSKCYAIFFLKNIVDNLIYWGLPISH